MFFNNSTEREGREMTGKRYGTKELIILLRNYILALGRIPTQSEVRAEPSLPSDETYINLYHTWERVIGAAGFTMNWCTREKKKKMLLDMRRKYVELGYKLPGPLDIQNDPEMEKVHVYVRVFGDLEYAKAASGIWQDYHHRQEKEIIKTIQTLADELGRVPKMTDAGMPNSRLVCKIFGSYAEAFKAAGFLPNQQFYDRKQLISQLRAKFHELGRSPLTQEIEDDPKMASMQTFRRQFGSYTAALKSANLPPAPRYNGYTRDELIRQLQEKYQELGRAPRVKEIDEDTSMASANVFSRMFGSYKAALENAGISLNRAYAKYSRDELIAQLQEKATGLGRTPKQKDVDADETMASVNTFMNEFGSFNEALREAQIKISRKREYTDEELLEMLKRKYIRVGFFETGRRPTNRDINSDPNMPSTRAYDKHFGTTNHARELVEKKLLAPSKFYL